MLGLVVLEYWPPVNVTVQFLFALLSTTVHPTLVVDGLKFVVGWPLYVGGLTVSFSVPLSQLLLDGATVTG
jgi:hypothetical protein